MKTSKILTATVAVVFLLAGSALAVPLRDPQVTIGATSSPDAEDTLQEILDNVIVNDENGNDSYNLAAEGDQSSIMTWMADDFGPHAYSVSIFSPWLGTFGVYSGDTKVELLKNLETTENPYLGESGDFTGDTEAQFYVNGAGELSFTRNGSVVADGFGTFGFYYERGNYISYTEDYKNDGGAARALSYLLADGTEVAPDYYLDYDNRISMGFESWLEDAWTPTVDGDNDWLLAFEAGSDNDFQDSVFMVEDIEPVPEPATILLFGAGLLGLAAYGRKKGFRRS